MDLIDFLSVVHGFLEMNEKFGSHGCFFPLFDLLSDKELKYFESILWKQLYAIWLSCPRVKKLEAIVFLPLDRTGCRV